MRQESSLVLSAARGSVLLPEQLPGGVFVPVQLFVKVSEVGQRAVGFRFTALAQSGGKQSCFQLGLGHLRR